MGDMIYKKQGPFSHIGDTWTLRANAFVPPALSAGETLHLPDGFPPGIPPTFPSRWLLPRVGKGEEQPQPTK